MTNVGTARISYKVLVDEPKGVRVSVEPKVLYFKKLREKLSYKVNFTELGLIITSKSGISSFGSLIWVGGHYSVRSPIVVTWQ